MLGKRRPARRPEQRDSVAAAPRNDAPETTDPEVVSILRLAHDGRGVARDAAGKTLFVDQALPGERVRVAIHRHRKRFDEAHVRELLVPSSERVSPPCPHYAQCGGCDLQHLALEAQRHHKREVLIDQLARQGLTLDIPPLIIADAGLGYRRRARLGVRVDTQGQVHLGFRARGSHQLVDIRECPILMPALAELLPSLHECLETLEAPRQVGHIEVLADDSGIAVVLRQLRPNAADARVWRHWAESRGLFLGLLQGREHPEFHWVGKAPRLSYTLKSHTSNGTTQVITLGFAPGDFLQVNAHVNQALVSTALEWLQPRGSERALDLFAGVGNFSLALAPRVARVVSVEGSEAMVERLRDNARDNALTNVEARCGNLKEAPALDPTPDIVVLDPPRSGAEAVCRRLAASSVSRILYVSCDAATLARDAAQLAKGGYHISRAAVADMFAQTAHLEAMLLFERGTS